MIVSGHTTREVEAMDFYLDNLLHLPNMTVVGCQEVEASMVLKLECLKVGELPACLSSTWRSHLNAPTSCSRWDQAQVLAMGRDLHLRNRHIPDRRALAG